MKNKKMKDEKGKCPKCGNVLTGYEEPSFYDDEMYFEWGCKNCGFSGKEYYKLNFIGHYDYYDEDGECPSLY